MSMIRPHLSYFCLLFLGWNALLFCSPNQPPTFVVDFFKRFSAELGTASVWSFTTPIIITDWGMCTINTDEIIVTIGDETASWIVPGGPWSVEFIPEFEQIALVPNKSASNIHSSKIIKPLQIRCFSMPRPFTMEELVNKAYVHIERDILQLTEKEIKRLVRDVILYAQEGLLDEQAVLQQLLRKISEQVSYHQNHLESNYDYRVLKISAIPGAAGLILLGVSYYYYSKWRPNNLEFNDLWRKLEKMGLLFNRSYLLDTINVHIPLMLDNNQKELVKSSINRMNFLHFINGPLFEKMATSFLLSLGAWWVTGWALLGGFYPQHKKRYEHWRLVHDAIERNWR